MPYIRGKSLEQRRAEARQRVHEWRRAHPDRVRAYAQSPARKAAQKANNARWHVAHREDVKIARRTPERRAYQRTYGRARRAKWRAEKGLSAFVRPTAEEVREHLRARRRRRRARWRRAHPLEVRRQNRDRARRRTQRRPGWHRAKARRWRARHPEIIRERARNRSARERGAAGRTEVRAWRRIIEEHLSACAYCHRVLAEGELTRDHLVALAAGGTNWPQNIVPACARCNATKTHRYWMTFHPPVWRVGQENGNAIWRGAQVIGEQLSLF